MIQFPFNPGDKPSSAGPKINVGKPLTLGEFAQLMSELQDNEKKDGIIESLQEVRDKLFQELRKVEDLMTRIKKLDGCEQIINDILNFK